MGQSMAVVISFHLAEPQKPLCNLQHLANVHLPQPAGVSGESFSIRAFISSNTGLSNKFFVRVIFYSER